jgi:phenylpyruvate tautomerase
MPLLKLETTVAVSEAQRTTLLASLSKIVSETIGKPEQYVMVTLGQVSMSMSAVAGNAAFVDVRSMGGLPAEVNRNLAHKVTTLLHDSLGLPQNRVFLNFTNLEGSAWGWNGSTLG